MKGLRERLAGPLPPLAVAFALGIAGARAAACVPRTALWVGIIPAVLAGLGLARRLLPRRALAVFAVAFALAGLLRGRPATDSPSDEPGPGIGPCAAAISALELPEPNDSAASLLEVEAAVVEPPKTRIDHARLLLRVVRARPGARAPPERREIPFTAADFLADVRTGAGPLPLPGDGVRALLVLDDLSPELPARERRMDALVRRNIACTGAVVEGRLAVVDPAAGVRPAVERLRRRIARAIRSELGTGPDSALVAALSVGDRSGITAEQSERFSASGLAHLVSISGLHLALIVLGAFRVLAWTLGRTPLGAWIDPRRTAAIACLPLVPAYTLLAGADPPVVRAAFAAAAALLATASSRVAAPGPILAAAAMGCLALDPACLVDVSFQLSFTACAGLLLLGDGLRELVPIPRPPPAAPRWRRIVESLVVTVATTVAATLATLPLTALHFGRVSLVAVPANAIAVPLGSLLTAVAAVGGLLAGISPVLAIVPLAVAKPLALLLDGIAAHFAGWPLARVALPTPTMWECIAAWVAALLVAMIPRAPRRAAAALALVIAVALVPRAMAAGGDGTLRVDFLPVGQGDATLLRLPGGSTVLVDAGGDLRGERDIGAQRVVPHLAERGVLRLDALVITHLHPDHAGGAPSVLRAIPVSAVWTPPGELSGSIGGPLADAIAETGAVRKMLTRGDSLEWEGVRFDVLWPEPGSPSLHENDGSLVLRLVHGNVAVLLPGDIETPTEMELIAKGTPLGAPLVKAPHHGSGTSSTDAFIRATGASEVVFPVGRRNQFGFPLPHIVARWIAWGARGHRTDRGPVSFQSDGRTLSLLEPGPVANQLHELAMPTPE